MPVTLGLLWKTEFLPARALKRLYVDRRDRTNLLQGLGWQIEAVGRALSDPEVPIKAALCFVEAEWRMFSRPFVQDGVWVTWAKKLAEMIAAPGPLRRDVVLRIAERLAIALPPAARTLVEP